jgi:hypothetical protein
MQRLQFSVRKAVDFEGRLGVVIGPEMQNLRQFRHWPEPDRMARGLCREGSSGEHIDGGVRAP